jgi:hypothetical protein
MRWTTTTGDLIGAHDKTADGRGAPTADARASHLFVGGDGRDFATTAADANRLAGAGRPAGPAQDLHKLRGLAFARGGPWSPFFAAKTDVDARPPGEYARTETFDGAYFKSAHFDLEATAANKGRYETTYFEEICRPKIEGEPAIQAPEP